MGSFPAKTVVFVKFPFSDLSESKSRPALVLADAGRDDFVLCQITSRSYGDPKAVLITASDFENGGLQIESYVRPAKIFTANTALIQRSMGVLGPVAHLRVIDAIILLIKPSAISPAKQ